MPYFTIAIFLADSDIGFFSKLIWKECIRVEGIRIVLKKGSL